MLKPRNDSLRYTQCVAAHRKSIHEHFRLHRRQAAERERFHVFEKFLIIYGEQCQVGFMINTDYPRRNTLRFSVALYFKIRLVADYVGIGKYSIALDDATGTARRGRTVHAPRRPVTRCIKYGIDFYKSIGDFGGLSHGAFNQN